MAITIQDVQDLIQLLRERPEWRAEMERALLGEEFHSLPAIVRELAEAQKRTEARVEELAEAQKRTEARVEELAEAQKRTEARLETLTARVEELAEAQKRTDAQIAALVERMDKFQTTQERMEKRLGMLSGAALELRFAERAPAYLSQLALRVRVIPRHDFVARTQEAVEAGTLSEDEAASIARLDLLAKGVRRDDRAPIYFAVEISETIRSKDVTRAARRAKLLQQIYSRVLPVVAGDMISPADKEDAEELGVAIVLDGQVIEDED